MNHLVAMKYLLEGSCDGFLFMEAVEADTEAEAQGIAMDRLREAWAEEGDELSDFGDAVRLRPYEAADYARDAAPELLAACQPLIPTGLCLTNSNVPDNFVVPLDVTMGELRRLAAAIQQAVGA